MQPPPPGSEPQWGPSPNGPDDHGRRPLPPGYRPPPQQWADYGPPTSQQTVGGIALAAIGLLGLLGAILTLTLWINLSSAESRAGDVCNRFKGEYANACRHQVESMVPTLPATLVVCLFVIIAACLAAATGAAMLFVKKAPGQFLILGGGIVMLMLSIGVEARFGATSRVTYDLIAGLVIAVIGALMFVPAFRVLLALPPQTSRRTGDFPPGPWPQGPPPPPYGRPGPPPPW